MNRTKKNNRSTESVGIVDRCGIELHGDSHCIGTVILYPFLMHKGIVGAGRVILVLFDESSSTLRSAPQRHPGGLSRDLLAVGNM
jgi:hypothetical protein